MAKFLVNIFEAHKGVISLDLPEDTPLETILEIAVVKLEEDGCSVDYEYTFDTEAWGVFTEDGRRLEST